MSKVYSMKTLMDAVMYSQQKPEVLASILNSIIKGENLKSVDDFEGRVSKLESKTTTLERDKETFSSKVKEYDEAKQQGDKKIKELEQAKTELTETVTQLKQKVEEEHPSLPALAVEEEAKAEPEAKEVKKTKKK